MNILEDDLRPRYLDLHQVFLHFWHRIFYNYLCVQSLQKVFFTSLKYGKQVKIKHWKAEHTT